MEKNGHEKTVTALSYFSYGVQNRIKCFVIENNTVGCRFWHENSKQKQLNCSIQLLVFWAFSTVLSNSTKRILPSIKQIIQHWNKGCQRLVVIRREIEKVPLWKSRMQNPVFLHWFRLLSLPVQNNFWTLTRVFSQVVHNTRMPTLPTLSKLCY